MMRSRSRLVPPLGVLLLSQLPLLPTPDSMASEPPREATDDSRRAAPAAPVGTPGPQVKHPGAPRTALAGARGSGRAWAREEPAPPDHQAERGRAGDRDREGQGYLPSARRRQLDRVA